MTIPRVCRNVHTFNTTEVKNNMGRPPNIFLVGELPDPQWCPPFAALYRLKQEGHIALQKTGAPGMEIRAGDLDTDALVCRPSRGGYLSKNNVQEPRRRLVIATLSKGTENINLPDTYVRRIISVKGVGNAPAVAAHTILLASLLLRPADQASALMASGRFKFSDALERNSQQLCAQRWGCVGSGDQVKYLLPHLVAHRCREIRVFHPRITPDILGSALSLVPNKTQIKKTNDGTFCCVINGGGFDMPVFGTASLESLLSASDVISLHFPLISAKESKYDGFHTNELISYNSSYLEKIKRGACLINVSRGALINEDDVVHALASGRLGGVASDVIDSDAEKSCMVENSPLWQEFVRTSNDSRKSNTLRNPRIILTPHIGGGTREAIIESSRDIIYSLLSELSIPEKFYPDLQPIYS